MDNYRRTNATVTRFQQVLIVDNLTGLISAKTQGQNVYNLLIR